MTLLNKRKAIGLDFDGTIAQYENWKGEEHCGDPYPGAIDFIKQLHRYFDVVIFSARASTPKGALAIRQWVTKHKLNQYVMDVTNQKRYQFVAFIDDRAIPCDGTNYESILAHLNCT